jgi:hypothetical protein
MTHLPAARGSHCLPFVAARCCHQLAAIAETIRLENMMQNFINACWPRMLGALRIVSSLLLPGQSPGIVCSLVILAAVVQTGSYSILMPDSVVSLLQRASAFRSANSSEPKERPPNGGLSAVDFRVAAQ